MLHARGVCDQATAPYFLLCASELMAQHALEVACSVQCLSHTCSNWAAYLIVHEQSVVQLKRVMRRVVHQVQQALEPPVSSKLNLSQNLNRSTPVSESSCWAMCSVGLSTVAGLNAVAGLTTVADYTPASWCSV